MSNQQKRSFKLILFYQHDKIQHDCFCDFVVLRLVGIGNTSCKKFLQNHENSVPGSQKKLEIIGGSGQAQRLLVSTKLFWL